MTQRRASGQQARRVGVLTLVLALVLVGAAGVGAVALWSKGSLNELICDGECGPSAIATPDALARDGVPGAVAARAAGTGKLDPDAIVAAVRDKLGADALGSHVGFAAVDPSDGSLVGSVGAGTYVPASTTKLLTGLAALTELGPQRRFTTRVVRGPMAGSGERPDHIVLVGDGDPFLVTKLPRKKRYAVEADLATLASRTAASLRRSNTTSVRLDYETTLFKGPEASPAWEKSYVSQKIVTPITSLWANEGQKGGTRVADPAGVAAQDFARLLERRGIEVQERPREEKAQSIAHPIAAVQSATVAQIVEAMIAQSDNEAAEVLLRHIALEGGQPATFEGGVTAVENALRRLGVDTSGLVLHDGSGLSRQNRIAPQTLAEAVAAATRKTRTTSLVSDLAVGGFSGTLARRFDKVDAGRGVVRGKSGTLTGVHALAGYVTDRSGTPIAFAVMTDRTSSINPFVTEAALDRVVAALAECTCSSPPGGG